MASRMPSAPVDETIDVQPTDEPTVPPPPPPARTKQTARKQQPPRRPRAANDRAHIGRNVRRVLEQALMAVPEPEATEAVVPAAPSAPATPPAVLKFVSVYSPVSLHSPGECDAFIAFYQQQKAALEAQAEAAIIIVDTSSSSAESTPDHANRGSSQPE